MNIENEKFGIVSDYTVEEYVKIPETNYDDIILSCKEIVEICEKINLQKFNSYIKYYNLLIEFYTNVSENEQIIKSQFIDYVNLLLSVNSLSNYCEYEENIEKLKKIIEKIDSYKIIKKN